MNQPDDSERWESEIAPIFLRLMATLHSAESAAQKGPVSLISASDQLRAGWREVVEWISAHPCPIPHGVDRLRVIHRDFRVVARLFEMEATNPNGPNLGVIRQEIEALVGIIANTFAIFTDERSSSIAVRVSSHSRFLWMERK
jgi:hypothetical protein